MRHAQQWPPLAIRRRACAASEARRGRRASAASRITPNARTRNCACWCRWSRRIRKAGKAAGVLTAAETEIRRYIAAGCLYTAVGSDVGILARGSEQLLAKYR